MFAHYKVGVHVNDIHGQIKPTNILIISRGHPSGIKGEVPALTFDPEREDSNSKMEPSELLSKTPPKIRLTETVMHSQASSHIGKQNYGTKSVHNSIQK